NQRLEEINRVAKDTDFNGTKVLDVTTETTISIQVGSQDDQTINIKIGDQKQWNIFNENGTGMINLTGWSENRKVESLGFDVLERSTAATENLAGTTLADAFSTANGASPATNALYGSIAAAYNTANTGDTVQLVQYTADNGEVSYALRSSGHAGAGSQ